MINNEIKDKIKDLAISLGFTSVGFTKPELTKKQLEDFFKHEIV